MDFGDAIRSLKIGRRVARAGWNGKGMFLVLVPGSQGLTVDEGRPLAKAGLPLGTQFNYLPHIDMWTAQGDMVPWLASQTDVLAEDWMEIVALDIPDTAEGRAAAEAVFSSRPSYEGQKPEGGE
jgi:hypothetical protein